MFWALVTGASSGIGRAIAGKLSERYSVVLGGRGVARLAETQLCNPAAQTLCWPCDVALSAAPCRAVNRWRGGGVSLFMKVELR